MNNATNLTMFSSHNMKLFAAFFECFVSMLIIFGHILAIILIRRCRKIQSSVKILIQNLCVIDIVGGFWGLIRLTVMFNVFHNMELFCAFEVFIMNSIFIVSLLFVTSIAVDRYCSIFCPLKYVQHANNLFIFASAVCWLIGLIMSTIILLNRLDMVVNGFFCAIDSGMNYILSWFIALIFIN